MDSTSIDICLLVDGDTHVNRLAYEWYDTRANFYADGKFALKLYTTCRCRSELTLLVVELLVHRASLDATVECPIPSGRPCKGKLPPVVVRLRRWYARLAALTIAESSPLRRRGLHE
jgi:hypothetical protein